MTTALLFAAVLFQVTPTCTSNVVVEPEMFTFDESPPATIDEMTMIADAVVEAKVLSRVSYPTGTSGRAIHTRYTLKAMNVLKETDTIKERSIFFLDMHGGKLQVSCRLRSYYADLPALNDGEKWLVFVSRMGPNADFGLANGGYSLWAANESAGSFELRSTPNKGKTTDRALMLGVISKATSIKGPLSWSQMERLVGLAPKSKVLSLVKERGVSFRLDQEKREMILRRRNAGVEVVKAIEHASGS